MTRARPNSGWHRSFEPIKRSLTAVVLLLAVSGNAVGQVPTTSAASASSMPPPPPAPRPAAVPPSSAVPSAMPPASAVPAPSAVPPASAMPAGPAAEPSDAGPDGPDAAPDAAVDADIEDVAVEADAPPPAASSAVAPPPAVPSAIVPPPPASSPTPPPQGKDAPLWNILPIFSEPKSDGDGLAEQLLPTLGLGGRGNFFGFGVLLTLCALGAHVAGRGRRRLPLRGVLPRLVAGLHIGLRALVVVFAFVLLANWMPASYAPVLIWVALAAAAAAGWSARDFLPDIFAGLLLLIERRVRPGTWVNGDGFVGEIETLGARAARIRDADGRIVSVPNRKLLAGPVAIDTNLWPHVDVVVRVPKGTPPAQARGAIEDAALLSAWRVLRDRPEVRRDANDAQVWHVRVRLIEPRFVRSFESALIDHVEEFLSKGAGESASP